MFIFCSCTKCCSKRKNGCSFFVHEPQSFVQKVKIDVHFLSMSHKVLFKKEQSATQFCPSATKCFSPGNKNFAKYFSPGKNTLQSIFPQGKGKHCPQLSCYYIFWIIYLFTPSKGWFPGALGAPFSVFWGAFESFWEVWNLGDPPFSGFLQVRGWVWCFMVVF